MVEYLEFNSIDTIAVRVTGKITEEDWESLKNVISEKLQLYGKINWYYEMVDFKGWELTTFFLRPFI
jgi:hypothetical protein